MDNNSSMPCVVAGESSQHLARAKGTHVKLPRFTRFAVFELQSVGSPAYVSEAGACRNLRASKHMVRFGEVEFVPTGVELGSGQV